MMWVYGVFGVICVAVGLVFLYQGDGAEGLGLVALGAAFTAHMRIEGAGLP